MNRLPFRNCRNRKVTHSSQTGASTYATITESGTGNEEKKLEERLEVLSDRLEKSLGGKNPKEPETPKGPSSEELNFVRILYSTLLKNEVSEQYVNQILGEIEKFIRPGHSVDTILSNVYQKLICVSVSQNHWI